MQASPPTDDKGLSGDDSGGETPDPIPNSEVKSSSADGTAGVILWESRTSPGLFFFAQSEKSGWAFFLAAQSGRAN